MQCPLHATRPALLSGGTGDEFRFNDAFFGSGVCRFSPVSKNEAQCPQKDGFSASGFSGEHRPTVFTMPFNVVDEGVIPNGGGAASAETLVVDRDVARIDEFEHREQPGALSSFSGAKHFDDLVLFGLEEGL